MEELCETISLIPGGFYEELSVRIVCAEKYYIN
jgi:hypothetical protein